MKKTLLFTALFALIAAGGYYYFKSRSSSTPLYKTAPVERGDISETVTSTGTINAVTTVQVGSQISGTIQHILVDYNSLVKKNQIIARIDPTRYEADLEQAKGNLVNAQAQLDKTGIALADAERTLKRNQELLKDGYVAQSDVDVAQTARDSALAQKKSAEGAVAQAKGNLASSQTNLQYAIIRSPVEGIVISRNVDVGQTVAASFQTPTLFTIAQDLTKMEVDTSVDEADIGKTRTGQEVTFTVDAWPEKMFKGTVFQVRYSPVVTQNVVTYNVVVKVDNRELLLRPGMTANTTIHVRDAFGVLKIPNAALRYHPVDKKGKVGAKPAADARRKTDRNSAKVYVLDNDAKLRPVQVTTDIRDGSYTQLLSGQINEGDLLVIGENKANGNKPAGGSPPGMGGMGGPR